MMGRGNGEKTGRRESSTVAIACPILHQLGDGAANAVTDVHAIR